MKTKTRTTKTRHTRTTFRPETIELARRLGNAFERGETIADRDREQLRVDIAVAGSAFLQRLGGEDERGSMWAALIPRIANSREWSNAAAIVLALLLDRRLGAGGEVFDNVIDVLALAGIDLEAIGVSGSWFPPAEAPAVTHPRSVESNTRAG